MSEQVDLWVDLRMANEDLDEADGDGQVGVGQREVGHGCNYGYDSKLLRAF